MFDAPFGWENFESIELEACVVCQNHDSLQALVCGKWGGKWPLTEDRSILPITMHEEPSPSFNEALKKFIDFYKP